MFGPFFHTVVLEQIFGLYLFITAVILLSRVEFYRKVAKNMKPDSGAVCLSSSLGLLLGLFLVIIHNIWTFEPRIVVTILCWIVLIRAILWLSFPERMVALTKKTTAGSGYYVLVFIIAVIGVYLMRKGLYTPFEKILIVS